MTARFDAASLLEPLTPDEPCGRNLEDSEALNVLDSYQLFGQTTLEPEASELGASARREPRKSDRPPNWEEVRGLALEQLATSKDLRLLSYLSAAVARLDGLVPFVETLSVAEAWLTRYWTDVFPRLEEDDPIFRRNALNNFADPVAVVDGLRRAPLVSSRQHGRFSLRDLDIVAGLLSPGGSDTPADEAQIAAAFSEMPFAELTGQQQAAERALASLRTIDETMRTQSGIEGAPSFEGLVALLQRLDAALRARIAEHPEGVAAEAAGGAASAEGGGTIAVGSIRSRQDAVRALDAAAEFFRRNEPSSPVPMLVERAKRLVSKDFLEVLADIAPDGLVQAKIVGGQRDDG